MRAIVFHQAGPPSVLKLRNDAIEPRLGYGQVKVKVFATSVNPIDHKVRSGTYLPYTLKTPHVCYTRYYHIHVRCATSGCKALQAIANMLEFGSADSRC